MASLHARVLASVLLLAAAGLIALAAVTYAEQRSFLLGRVDQQLRGAGPAVSQALDHAGFRPAGENSEQLPPEYSRGDGGFRPGGGPPNLNLPPGTYGERREASGKVLGHILLTYGQSAPAAPKLPAKVPLGRLFTVGSVGSSGLQYRVYEFHDPEDSGLTIVAVPLHDVNQTLNRLLLVELFVIIGVLVALGLSAYFVVRLGLRPLDRIERTAGEIAAGQLSRRVSPATPRTEVGRLGLALNAMLERLEQAFTQRKRSEERLRQFLADASHELRTPLASIRGYAELFRMGATRDEAEIRTAMRRIEDESKRMGVLVEDLLTLARLDETPELSRTPIDLVALTRDAVEDAHATAPERAITLDAPDTAFVSGDSHRLHQVLANLIRNALVHTPAGTPIEISVAEHEAASAAGHDTSAAGHQASAAGREASAAGHEGAVADGANAGKAPLTGRGRTVTVTVRDHGPGLPDVEPERLFDRFWRAEHGRERGKAGAGLGLAIAAAVVEAHGGSITASGPPGGGALFTVVLPASPSQRPLRVATD